MRTMTVSRRQTPIEGDHSEEIAVPRQLDAARRKNETRVTELPQLLSPEEVARYLGVSSYTIRERLKCGELPGRKHGARWLVRTVDLIQYVEPNNLT